MADQLTRAPLVAEITELQKQQSESRVNDIYLGWTAEGQAAREKRETHITSLRLQLAALDATPGLIRGAPHARALRRRK